jgi:hypothetical protein
MLIYVVQTVPPEKASVEVFTLLSNAILTVRTTWEQLGAISVTAMEPQGGFSQYTCTLNGRLVGIISQRTLHEEATHL